VVLDQQTTLTNDVHEEPKFRKARSWIHRDIEDEMPCYVPNEDEMPCWMPAMCADLEDHKQVSVYLRLKQLQLSSKINILQAEVAKPVRHTDKVFKQNDMTLCIMKYFYTFGLFTDS
jgi:hypothetical protein